MDSSAGVKREVALAVGLVGVTEEPQRVGEAQPDEQLGVLSVAQHVRAPAAGLEALMAASKCSRACASRPGQ